MRTTTEIQGAINAIHLQMFNLHKMREDLEHELRSAKLAEIELYKSEFRRPKYEAATETRDWNYMESKKDYANSFLSTVYGNYEVRHNGCRARDFVVWIEFKNGLTPQGPILVGGNLDGLQTQAIIRTAECLGCDFTGCGEDE